MYSLSPETIRISVSTKWWCAVAILKHNVTGTKAHTNICEEINQRNHKLSLKLETHRQKSSLITIETGSRVNMHWHVYKQGLDGRDGPKKAPR